MIFDLTQDEMRRRSLMIAACDDWCPVEAFESEAEAYRLLYGNLDAQQQTIFDDLKAAGVLP